MTLIVLLDLLVVLSMVGIAVRKDFDSVLSLAAFYLIVFPYQSLIHLPGLFELTTQRIVGIVLFALYLIFGRKQINTLPKAKLPLVYLLLALIIWMLFSSAKSIVPAISFKTTLSQYFDYILIYFLFSRGITSRESINKIFTGVVAGMGFCCICGILEQYTSWSVLSMFPSISTHFGDLEVSDDRGLRMQASFEHPILFGAALSLAIPMAFYLLSNARTNIQKAYYWVAILIMSFCIFKATSRGPWLALAMSLAILFVLGKSQIRKSIVILLISSVLVLIARPGMMDTILNLYKATFDPESSQGSSYQWRYLLIHIAGDELTKHPDRSIWGFGPESFFYLGITTEMMFEGEIRTVKVESCDNAWVALVMETGFVGIGLVALLMLTTMYNSMRSYFAAKDTQYSFYLVVFANLCAYSFLMSNVALFGWGQQTYILWIAFAIAMTYPRLRSISNSTDLQKLSASQFKSAFTAPVLGQIQAKRKPVL